MRHRPPGRARARPVAAAAARRPRPVLAPRASAGAPESLLVLPEPAPPPARLRRGGAEVAADPEPDGLRPYVPGTPMSRVHWAERGPRRRRCRSATSPAAAISCRWSSSTRRGAKARRWTGSRARPPGIVLALARAGGCRVLLPGDRVPTTLDDIGGWPALHRRLAALEPGAPARARRSATATCCTSAPRALRARSTSAGRCRPASSRSRLGARQQGGGMNSGACTGTARPDSPCWPPPGSAGWWPRARRRHAVGGADRRVGVPRRRARAIPARAGALLLAAWVAALAAAGRRAAQRAAPARSSARPPRSLSDGLSTIASARGARLFDEPWALAAALLALGLAWTAAALLSTRRPAAPSRRW